MLKGLPEVNGDEPAGDWATSHDSVHVFVSNESNAMLVGFLLLLFFVVFFLFFSIEKILCPSSVAVLPKFFHLISQNQRMFRMYLSISCVSSRGFPAALNINVLVFHVPMVMLSLRGRDRTVIKK